MSKVSMEELFLKLGNFDGESTRFVKVNEFVGEYSNLKLGNGCSWGRKDGNIAKKCKLCIKNLKHRKELLEKKRLNIFLYSKKLLNHRNFIHSSLSLQEVHMR